MRTHHRNRDSFAKIEALLAEFIERVDYNSDLTPEEFARCHPENHEALLAGMTQLESIRAMLERKPMTTEARSRMDREQLQCQIDTALARARGGPQLGTTWVASQLREDGTDRSDPGSVALGFMQEMRARKWRRATRYIDPPHIDLLLATVKLDVDRAEQWTRIPPNADVEVVSADSRSARLRIVEHDLVFTMIDDGNEWWIERWIL